MLEETFKKINSVISGLKKQNFTTSEINKLSMEMRNILLQADIPYSYVQIFTNKLKQKLSTITDKKLNKPAVIGCILKNFFDKTFDNSNANKLELKPFDITTISVFGTNGVGKTSFVAKLANLIQTEHKKNVICISFDKTRPAAQEQLKILCQKNNINFISPEYGDNDMEKSLKRMENIVKDKLADVLIVDNAGISPDDQDASKTLLKVLNRVIFDERILVLDGTFGQNAVNLIKSFDKLANLTGFAITKTESDQKGGVFFATRSVSKKPIYYITNGEKINNIKQFNSKAISEALIDGELQKLLNAFQTSNKEQIQALLNKVEKQDLNYNDLLQQLTQLVNFGKLDKILSVLPHTKTMFNVKLSTEAYILIKHWIAIIQSMTNNERNTPSMLNIDRINRIAKGSGCSVSDVLILKQKLEEINLSSNK